MNAPATATPEQVIDGFIDRFYARVFKDPLLAPVFLTQAGIDPAVHIPHIKAYSRDLLPDLIQQALSEVDAIDRPGSVRAVAVSSGVELSIRFWHVAAVADSPFAGTLVGDAADCRGPARRQARLPG